MRVPNNLKLIASFSVLLFLFLIFYAGSCSKNKTACWQGFSPLGYDVQGLLVCDKTKAEAEAAYSQYWFYNANEKKYCWRLQTQSATTYMRNVPESMIDKMRPYYGGYTFTKTDCNSFCIWIKVLEKHKSKITGFYGPTRQYVETFTADSCSKLYEGRIIVFRETADSIITREFTEKIP